MSAAYEQEQAVLKDRTYALKEELAQYKDTSRNYEHWLKIIRKYSDIEELNKAMLHELVERIEIGQGTIEYNGHRAERKKQQEITIFLQIYRCCVILTQKFL